MWHHNLLKRDASIRYEGVVLFYAGTADDWLNFFWYLFMACGVLYIGHSPRAVVIINVRWSAGQGRARSRWSSRVHDVRAALLSRLILARPIQDAILTCNQKLARVNLICCTEPTAKKWKRLKLNSKKWICSEVSVNSTGNLWSQSWRREGRLQWKD